MIETFVRINYTYGQSGIPKLFNDLAKAQEEIPTNGSAVIFVYKEHEFAQEKYWYDSKTSKWNKGRPT